MSTQSTGNNPNLLLDPAAVLAAMEQRAKELASARAEWQQKRLRLLGEAEGLKEELSFVESEIAALNSRIAETRQWQERIKESRPAENVNSQASGE